MLLTNFSGFIKPIEANFYSRLPLIAIKTRHRLSFYTKPELLVGVFPSGDVEADEASQEGNDLVAGDF